MVEMDVAILWSILCDGIGVGYGDTIIQQAQRRSTAAVDVTASA